MANDVGIRVGVEGEKQFKDSMNGINSQLKNLKSELEASRAEFGKNADSQEALKQKAEILGRTVDVQKQKVEQLTKQYKIQSDKLPALSAELDRVSEEFGANSTEAGKAERAYNRQATEVNNLGSQLNTAKSDLKNFETQMQEATRKSGTFQGGLERAADGLGKFSKKASKVGGTLTKYVTVPLLGLGTLSFKSASDLNENLNKTEVAFGENADAIVKWSKTTLKQYGLAQNSALEMAATWGDMGTSMELPLDTATEMSKSLVGLAADMASFKNISVERAQTALNSVYTGETESLKALGIVMTEANLEAYAMAKGIKKSYKDMSQAEKVTLRYQYVLDKTKNAQGDFSRTSDGAANQMRIAQESAKELAASFGQKLLPVGTKLLKFANGLLDSFNNLDDGTKDLIIRLGLGAAAAGPLIKGIGKITDVGKSAIDTASKLTGRIKDIGTAASDSAGKTGLLNKALGTIFSPTGLIAGATVGALAGSIWAISEGVAAMSKPGEELAEALGNVMPNLEKYQGYIDGAASALEGFNIEQTSAGELIKTYDEQVASSIDSIHTIINTAASQSRTFTESEYAQIQELIGMIDDYTSKKVEAYQQQQQVVQVMAEQEVSMTKERSAELVKAAEETRDEMIAAANAQYQGVLGEAIAMYEAKNITKEQYDEMIKNAQNAYYEQERMANESYANTIATISEAYYQQNIANNKNVGQWKDYYAAMDMAAANHEDRMAFYNDQLRQGLITREAYDLYAVASEREIADERKRILHEMVQNGAKLFDEATSDNLSYWLTMQSQTKLYGGKVSEEEQKFIDIFTDSIDKLPPQMRAAAEETWRGYEEKTKEMMPRILRNTTNDAMNIINTIKNTMQIHSPSRVMRRLAGYFWEGWESQSEKSGKEAAAQASVLAERINDSFQNEIGLEYGITDFAGRGRQIADAVEQRINANINPARREIVVSMPQGNAGTTLNQTNNFYSPEALSPAETARLNRNNVRNTIRMLRS